MSKIKYRNLKGYKYQLTEEYTVEVNLYNENIETPYNYLAQNQKGGTHTLLLLDLNPEKEKYLTISDGIRYLLRTEIRSGKRVFTNNTFCIGCTRLGSLSYKIKAGPAKDLLKEDFGKPPHCLIVPGKLHFMEEEALELYK